MTSLKSFIKITEKEEKNNVPKIAVIVFGRFQPPTKGHSKIIDVAHRVATEKGGEVMVFPSQTVDSVGRNPLDWSEKIRFLKKLMPKTQFVQDSNVKNAWSALDLLDEKGYTEVYLVTGSDRVEEYNKRWLPYAEKSFQRAGVISAGSRDPDDENSVEGMSGTKARQAAMSGNIGVFRAATGWEGDIATQLMIAVKKGLPGSR